jgi:transcriptional regulator with XRE-family HTH domain
MTTRQLAKAVGVTQAAVVDAERTEAKGAITLTTLQRYAAALGCELTYALVPKRPLQEVVEVSRECAHKSVDVPFQQCRSGYPRYGRKIDQEEASERAHST